jgi:ketosteroid isomerase-like protein
VYHRIVARFVRRRYADLNRHDPSGVLARFADDVHFRFGGEHPLTADCRGRADAERWFGRLFATFPDLSFEVEEVIVAGPPWNTRICTRYTTRASVSRGATLVNRGVQVAWLRWGSVTEDLLYPDTQAVARALAAAI